MNLDAVLKIAARVTGTDAVQALGKAIAAVEQTAGSAKKAFTNVINSATWQAAAVGAAAIGAGLALSIKQAIEFESAMTGVARVIDGLDTPEGLREVREEIMALSREIPISQVAFAELYEAAGQAGIARNEVKAFAEDVSRISVAWQMTAAETGESLAKLRANLGLTQPELVDLADAMNALADSGALNIRQMNDFMQRAASMGAIAGLTGEQTAAFGQAMIGSGAAAEVAATSFNNMIKALSAGPSMTEKQASALTRLGYATRDAAKYEKEMTRTVEEESAKRLRAIDKESSRAVTAVNRRYRDMLTAMQDGWDDEDEAQQDAIDQANDAQVRGLERQRDAAIDAARRQQELTGRSNDAAITALEQHYDDQIRTIEKQESNALKQYSRAQRDKRQVIQDNLEDQKQLEIDAVQEKYDELKKIEELRKQDLIAEAKATAKAIAAEMGVKMAKDLQNDAVGTIRDLFERIRALPKEQQISALTDLMGDEAARGLLPLINNIENLDKALNLVADRANFTGSNMKEFLAQLGTTDAQLQLFKNGLDEIAITVGESLLPALKTLLEIMKPMLDGFNSLAKASPELTTAIVVLGGALAALVALAPFINATIALLTTLGGLGLGATIAGWAGAIGPALASITALFAAWAPAIVAFFTGPVGWTVLAVAAVVAMAYMFREPLMEFVSWVGGIWGDLWTALGTVAYDLFVKPWVDLWETTLRDPVTKAWDWLVKTTDDVMTALGKVAYDLFVKPWVDLWETVMRKPVSDAWEWIKGTFTAAAENFRNNVVDPIRDKWVQLTEFLPKAMERAANFVKGVWQGVVDKIKEVVNGTMNAIANTINTVIGLVNNVIKGFNALEGPDIKLIPTVSVPKFAQGGFVTGPTLAMVGDNPGGREYIVPEGKASAFANNIIAGRRGAAAIPATTGSSAAPVAAPINITTGPVMEMDGTRYVKVEDLERAVQQTQRQIYATLRTPGGRRAIGLP